MHIGTRYVILAKHWMWLPDDGFMWTETWWSSFYSFNYFNNLRILQFVCISWKIKCLILLMHCATMKLIFHSLLCSIYFSVHRMCQGMSLQLNDSEWDCSDWVIHFQIKMRKTDAKYSHCAGKAEIERKGLDGICLVYKRDQFLGTFFKIVKSNY